MKKFNNYHANINGKDVTLSEDYLVTCIRSAISYCKSQFEQSGIDWLPSIDFVDPTLTESDKFNLLSDFATKLCLNDNPTTNKYAQHTVRVGRSINTYELVNDDTNEVIFAIPTIVNEEHVLICPYTGEIFDETNISNYFDFDE